MYRQGCCWDTQRSVFAGMPTELLAQQLSALQMAYLQLASGAKVITASYTQGDGQKSVTYNQASMGTLLATIRQLQAQLGIICHVKRPMRFRFAY